MILVYIPGVWDLLHVGHVRILKAARKLGDRLVVGVPSDDVVELDKGAQPVITLEDRLTMLRALACVSVAIPYYRLEFLTHLHRVRPDILVVGEEWGHETRHTGAVEWCHDSGCRIVRLPRHQGCSTTQIKERCRCESII